MLRLKLRFIQQSRNIKKALKTMNRNLQKAIQKLKEKKLDFQLIRLKNKAFSAQDVVRYSDKKLDEVCKTIVLSDSNGKLFATFLPGNRQVDLKKVEEIFGCFELKLAKAKELREKLKMKPGEVCPLLLNIPLVMDESVFKKEKINFGSGDLRFGIEMKPQDILKFTHAKISRVAK